MKRVCIYAQETGEYIGHTEAEENPLEPGKYLLPAFSTEQEPPTPGANEVPVFMEGVWIFSPDFRGQTFYSKSTAMPILVRGLGALDSDLTDTAPGENSVWSESGWIFNTEKALKAIRAQRNSLLSACDWTQVSDAPFTTTVKAAWKAYRQALRDLPETCDPAAPLWPTEPV